MDDSARPLNAQRRSFRAVPPLEPPSYSSSRSMNCACPGRILTRASSGREPCVRGRSRGRIACGRSSAAIRARSDSTDKRRGIEIAFDGESGDSFRLGCAISPRFENFGRPVEARCRVPLRTREWRRRAGLRLSEYSPLGIDQAPWSLLAQNGPPGCARSSSMPARRAAIHQDAGAAIGHGRS